MADDDLENLLRSPSSFQRLQGLRLAAREHIEIQEDTIRRLLLDENPWVKFAAQYVAETARGQDAVDQSLAEEPPIPQDVYAAATREVAGVLVHEIRPLIYDVHVAAREELADYEASQVAGRIARLRDFVASMASLHSASAPPSWEELDLASLVRRIAASSGSSDIPVVAASAETVSVVSDRIALELVIRNAVRNAVDAIAEQIGHGGGSGSVVVACGSTPKEYWVSVLDSGAGLPPDFETRWARRRFRSTKSGHSGLGLQIAIRAAESLGGVIEVSRRIPMGTSFHFRAPDPMRQDA